MRFLDLIAALGRFEVELPWEPNSNRDFETSRARGRIDGRLAALDAIKVTAAKARLAAGTMTAAEGRTGRRGV